MHTFLFKASQRASEDELFTQQSDKNDAHIFYPSSACRSGCINN